MTEPLIIFDLDDTLYLERDFAHSGYRAVGEWVRKEHGVPHFDATCRALLDGGRRERIFNEALAAHAIYPSSEIVAQLVALYRLHVPEIGLAPDAARFFARRPDGVFGMITDGNLATQQAKVWSLGLIRLISNIVFTDSLGKGFSKPHPRAFIVIEGWAAQFRRPLVYVADNPLKDFVTPRKRGWKTVRICRPERIHRVVAPDKDYEAHASIASLDELDDCTSSLLKVECA